MTLTSHCEQNRARVDDPKDNCFPREPSFSRLLLNRFLQNKQEISSTQDFEHFLRFSFKNSWIIGISTISCPCYSSELFVIDTVES